MTATRRGSGDSQGAHASVEVSPRAARVVPPPPSSLHETGLTESFVSALVLKALYVRGEALGVELGDQLALPMAVLDDIIQQLQEWRLVEVHSTRGPRRGEWMFRLTTAGRKRASEELDVSRYVGPAPVPFEDWVRYVEMQAPERARFSQEELRKAFEGVVLPDGMYDLLGPAINSGRSLFLHGGPGNGKTLLAERVARLFGDRYYVPYAVLVDGSVMVVHDPVLHASDPETTVGGDEGGDVEDHTRREILRPTSRHDRRYAEARRPVVVTGGELTLEQLDLQWDPSGRMYQAPPQLKAAGGVLVVDDLGRQRVPVRDLLNRWVVPLEHRRDYLTLRSGRKVVVPFDCFVIFSTNLEPGSLADEAFLRRIHYKVHVPDPDRVEYEQIFRACCSERDVPFDEGAVDFLYERFYADGAVKPRRCHPRDVLEHLRHLAEYRGIPAHLELELLEHACSSYFLPSAVDGSSTSTGD